jgi:DNA polymerase-3 subunit alpha
MSSKKQFIHLHVHSAYSLAEGAIKINALIDLCIKYKMPAVAITDTNNMFGALEFAVAAADAGVQPIIGCQIQLDQQLYELVLLCQSHEGYKNLCKLTSLSYLDKEFIDTPFISLSDLEKNNEGLICLTGGIKGPLSQNILSHQKDEAERILASLSDIFGDRLYIELQRHGLDDERKVEPTLLELAYDKNIPLVATNDCFFTDYDMHEAHDALLCIADGRYINEDNRRRVSQQHYFKSSREMSELFKDLPEAIENTTNIAKRCHFLLQPIQPILPPFETESKLSEDEEIKMQANAGLQWRLENFVFTDEMDEKEREEIAKPYYERQEYELSIIIEMGFSGYFLIVSDFIKWAKEQNIPVGPGRGSGAGSVVAWALKIIDINPLEFNLLFERLLNPERVSMPDFDIDFCQERRDEVIRYVQERYGYDRVAQIITFGKLQARAVVRDVGRVLQMPYGQVDRIAKMIPANPANPISLKEALQQDEELRKLRVNDDTTDKLISIALKLEGLFRHASTHAAGVVIGDRPLHELVPLYRDPRSDMPVTQFNMKYVERAGLVKFDFLGLKNMTVIQKTVDFIKESKDKDIDILKVPLDDSHTFEMLAKGENTGVFQMESAGMRDLGKQMQISTFEHIIAVVALYRPGPMENIPKYLACLHGKETIDYMHPVLKPILEDTYGVMIYQEQVMQAAQLLSGYTLGGADLLRRAMGKKIQKEMDAQRELFVTGAKKHNDVSEEKANAIFDQINKFAGYGFNKAHSAGYALIAYWTAWLKANYPMEFMAASMTLDFQNTDKLAVFKQELDRMNIHLITPDINKSFVEFKVSDQGIIYSMAALKGVGSAAVAAIVKERDENGIYATLDDFINRIDLKTINKRQLEQLIYAGALDSIESNRAKLFNNTELILRYAHTISSERSSGQSNMFLDDPNQNDLNTIKLKDYDEWNFLDKLRHEFESVGFYLSAHPLDTRQSQFKELGITLNSDISETLEDHSSAMIEMAGVLLKKQIKVSPKSKNKYAFLQLSDTSGVYEVILFSELLHNSNDILEVGETYYLKVLVEQKEDQIRYTVQGIQLLESALANKIKEVVISLKNTKVCNEIKNLLQLEGNGPSKIILRVDINEDEYADIELKGNYKFSAEFRQALLNSKDIINISEI